MTGNQGVALGCVVLVMVAGMGSCVACLSMAGSVAKDAESAPRVEKTPMVGGAAYRDFAFHVKNANDFDWTDCRMTVNGDWDANGWRIGAGGTAVIPAGEFTKRNGERFNPLSYRPQSLSVRCKTPGGRDGAFYTW